MNKTESPWAKAYAKHLDIACGMRTPDVLARLSRMGIIVMPACDGGLAVLGPERVPIEADALLCAHYDELVDLVSMPPASRVLS